MRKHWKIMTAIGLLSTILILITVTTLQVESSQADKPSQKKTRTYLNLPVTRYDAELPTDSEVRQKRLNRGRRFNMKLPDPEVHKFQITEKSGDRLGIGPYHAPAEPALPVVQSDAVIRGKVIEAHAFISENKTSVYTEFAIEVLELLADKTTELLYIGQHVIATRGGGAVQFPSGRIIQIARLDKPLPRKGNEYIFFLDWDATDQSFSIITGYLLQEGKAVPLDGLVDGDVVSQFSAHQEYQGMDSTLFLNEVRVAISTGHEERRRENR